MREVRGSEIFDFLRCRYMWSERWLNNLVPKKKQTPLLFGTAIHKWLECWYIHRDTFLAESLMMEVFENAEGVEQTELEDMIDLAKEIVHNYSEQYPEDENWTVLAAEMKFRIPLYEHIMFAGTIDLIYKDKDRNLWIADHKTSNNLDKYVKNSVLDRQISRYIWAVQQLTNGVGEVWCDDLEEWVEPKWKLEQGLIVHGFCYNLILKDVPKPPKVLKGGGLSKDKSQKTTYQLYGDALVNMGLASKMVDGKYITTDDTSYDEILQLLLDQETEYGNRFFKRVPVYRLQQEVDASIQEFYHTAKELIGIESAVKAGVYELVYRNITQDCAWCAYQSLCSAGIEGSDVEHIRNTLYVTEEK